MPRTKAKQSFKVNDENVKPTKTKLRQEAVNCFLKAIEDELKEKDAKIQAELERLLLKCNTGLSEIFMKFPRSDTGKTIAELGNEKVDSIFISDSTALKSVNASVRSVRRFNNQPTASKDCTLSVSKMNSGIRKVKNVGRSSRSMSKSKLQLAAHCTLSSFVTPTHKNLVPQSFGTVTPKVKPNTPQVVLRRPKQGEMALSMQGSPLMVSSVSSDAIANVNIPLEDGRILTIQPQRGLRASEMPQLDAETLRQIETLRDNLNKFCTRPV